MTYSYSGPMGLTPLLLFLNGSTVSIPSTLPGTLPLPCHFSGCVHTDHSQFHTSVHVKPTNSQHYLHYHSCHPISSKHSVPYSLDTQGHHICIHPDDLHTYILIKPSPPGGYPVPLIQKQQFHGLHHPNPSASPPPPGPPSLVSHHYLLYWPLSSQTDPQGRFPYPLSKSINLGPSH